VEPVEDERRGQALLRHGIALRAANGRGEERGTRSGASTARLVKKRRAQARPVELGGLTKSQAERELRRLMESVTVAPTTIDLAEAGRRWLAHLETIGRRRSTLMDYESAVRVHLVPFFGSRAIGKIAPADIEAFMAAKRREGKSAKSVRNWLGVLHTLLSYAERRDLIASNPCRKVDFPRIEETDADIRFLSAEASRRCCGRSSSSTSGARPSTRCTCARR
jgi:hypothetical protein